MTAAAGLATEPHYSVVDRRLLADDPLDLVDGVGLGAGDKAHLLVGQLIENLVVEEAQVEDDQGLRAEFDKRSLPEGLVVGLRVFLVPDLTGQLGANIEQRGDSSRQRSLYSLTQEPDFAQEHVERRAIQSEDLAKVTPGVSDCWRQGSIVGGHSLVHSGQDVQKNSLEQLGRKGPQAQGERLLGDLGWTGPEEAFALERAHRFPDRADLAPDQAQDEGHHHGQAQDALAQAQLAVKPKLVVDGRVDEVFQKGLDRFGGWRCGRTLAPIPLNRSGMANTARLDLGLLSRIRLVTHTKHITANHPANLTASPQP